MDDINVDITQNNIDVELSSTVVNVDVELSTEVINVDISENTINVDIVDETIDVDIVEAPNIDVDIVHTNIDVEMNVGSSGVKVKVTGNDTTSGYLNDEITVTDTSLIKEVLNPSGDEKLDLRLSPTMIQDIDFDGYNILDVGKVKHDTNYAITGLETTGTSYWDSENRTYSDVLENGVTGQRYKEDFDDGQNDTGVTLVNGTVATYAGSIGNSGNKRIEHTVASASEPVLYTLGIITADIINGDSGEITTRGKVRGVQTDGANYGEVWSDGDIVYKSSTIAGGLTNVMPQAPIPAIPMAVVISAHGSNGTLYVRPTFPEALVNLTDVDGTPLTTTGQLPVWDNDRGVFDFDRNMLIAGESTGFQNPKDVIITGNGDRTITLTGSVEPFFLSKAVDGIVSGWTSDPHPNITTEQYFLIYDGTTIEWLPASAGFGEELYKNLLITFGAYDNTNGVWVYVREPHGLMPWQTHREFHNTTGTYRRSGGGLQDYILDSTTLADRRPSVEATLLYDEDLPTLSPVLNNSLYSNFFLTGADGDINVNKEQADIVPLSGNRPYWNEFTGGVWQQTLMSNNFYMPIWELCLPTASDNDSQQWRYLWVQGQHEDNSLANIQALTPQDVSIGKLRELLPELVVTNKIIIQFTANNWKFIEVSEITGTSSSQTTSPAGNYLTSVTSDATIDGLGTPSVPLSIATSLSQYARLDGTNQPFTDAVHINNYGDYTKGLTIGNNAVGNAIYQKSNTGAQLYFALGGADKWLMLGDQLRSSVGSGGALQNRVSNDTSPTLQPRTNDDDTGIGGSSANTMSLITGGVEAQHISASQNIGIGIQPLERLHTYKNNTTNYVKVESTDFNAGIYFDSNRLGVRDFTFVSNGSNILFKNETDDAGKWLLQNSSNSNIVSVNYGAPNGSFDINNAGNVTVGVGDLILPQNNQTITQGDIDITYTGSIWKVDAPTDVAQLTNNPSGGTDLAISTVKYVNDTASGGGSGGFFKGYINGGIVSNDGTTPDEIVNISEVRTRSEDDTQNLVVADSSLDIMDDADWANNMIPMTEQDLFVAMTSNLLPVPEEAWATSQLGTSNPTWKAFNKTTTDTNDCWISASNASIGTQGEIDLRKMTSDYPIERVEITSRNTNIGALYPVDFTLVYTTDDMSGYSNIDATLRNISFTTVKTLTAQSFTQAETKSYTLDSDIPINATAWGIRVTKSNATFPTYGVAGIINGFGEAPDLTDMSIFVWADYNSGANRTILDDATGSNILGAKRRIGSFVTDSNGDIRTFKNIELGGGGVQTLTGDILLASLTTSYVEIDLDVPIGIPLEVDLFVLNQINTSTTVVTRTTGYSDIMPVKTLAGNEGTTGVNRGGADNTSKVLTDNGKIFIKAEVTGNSYVSSQGYTDERTA